VTGQQWQQLDLKPTEDFLSDIFFIKQNILYPQSPHETLNLTNFQHWDKTKFISREDLCLEMRNARSWLMDDQEGYYIRKDWECKRVFVIGDIHGSLHSLVDVLLDMVTRGAFKPDGSSLQDDVALVFLGDLLDRSPYTLECLYLVLRLCRTNQDRCVLVCGNHETDENQWESKNGTIHEINGEYRNVCSGGVSMLAQMQEVTRRLPSALIARTPLGIVQFNHGSFERFKASDEWGIDFLLFINFHPGDDTMSLRGTKEHNPLQWADVGTAPMDAEKLAEVMETGRYYHGADLVQNYLNKTGIRMIIRGHSDQANLALLFKGDSEPSRTLQRENSMVVPPDTPYPWYDSPMKDGRELKDRALVGNSFKRQAVGLGGDPFYDTWILEEVPGHPTFEKNLITKEDPNPDLICVTTASCPFSKPMPPINMMSSYLVLGQPSVSESELLFLNKKSAS
jgi:hypothetical protein